MFANKIGALSLLFASMLAVSGPATLQANDYDRDRNYGWQQNRYSERNTSERDRRDYNERLRREEIARERWEREQYRDRNRRPSGFNFSLNFRDSSGYYDRNGNWHR